MFLAPSTLSRRNREVHARRWRTFALQVSWADFLVAGELTLDTKERAAGEGVDAFHVSAQAQSVGLDSAMAMKVNDTHDSFLNAATLAPVRAAETFQLKDHGRIAVGKRANLVVFDPDRVIDRETFGDSRQYPEGIPHIIVGCAGRR